MAMMQRQSLQFTVSRLLLELMLHDNQPQLELGLVIMQHLYSYFRLRSDISTCD